jgi:uncharacterized repeat protein (TIGR03803 family)
MGKLNWAKRISAVFLLCATTAIELPAQTFATLHSFDGTDGALPPAGLIQATDGNFYGTTGIAGANSDGTVFKITPSGTLTTLYNFCSQSGCADGQNPSAGLIQATDGNFYGTTSGGGVNLQGTIFRITASGALTTLYSFCSQSGCTDGDTPLAGLIQATDGNFYGTTQSGGTNRFGTVFKITTEGTLTTLYSFCAQSSCTDGSEPMAGLVQAADGNLYGTTSFGGANTTECSDNGCGTVFKITTSGTLTTLYSFCSKGGCADGAEPDAGLAQATDGDLYGTTAVGGGVAGGGTVFKITPSGALTILYSFCSNSGCTDGSNPFAGLVQATDGNLYGTSGNGGANTTECSGSGCGTVFRITTSGTLTTLYSFCSQTNCTDGSRPLAGLIQATNGNLYGTTENGGANEFGTVFSLTLSVTEPSVSLSPTSLTFTPQIVGTTSSSKAIAVTNTGTGALSVSAVAASGDFAETDNCTSGAVQPGKECTINVTATPSIAGSISGEVTISDNAAGTPQLVNLTATGQNPLSAAPASAAFGTVAVGSNGAKTVTLTNNDASGSLSISFSTTGDYTAAGSGASPCSTSLLAKKKCTITVTFSPTYDGMIDGALSIAYGAGSLSVALSGTGSSGATASLTFSPASLSFTNVLVGSTSNAKTITVTNSSAAAINISGIAASGNYSAAGSGATPCGGPLAAGSKCTISVTFSPTEPGTTAGAITITDNGVIASQYYKLTGTAVLPVTLSPASLTFASQSVGTTSSPSKVSLTNNQSVTLDISGIVASGDYAITLDGTTPCGASVPALGKCTFGVEFAPSSTGKIKGVVTLSTNASGSPQEVKLTGTGN